MVDKYKTPEQCASDLDAALDHLVYDDNGTFKGKTCFCCDCFLLHIQEHPSVYKLNTLKKCAYLFKLQSTTVHMVDHMTVTIPDDVILYYKYHVGQQYAWLEDCVISPNACYDRKRKGFLVCQKCLNSLIKKRYPVLGIKNGFMIGTAPDIIKSLSDEELSCISLVRNTGHVFTYMGGQAATMRGWHSMLEIDLHQIKRTL